MFRNAPNRLDLWVITLLTVISIGIALSGVSGLIGSGAVLLVLILPGCALTAALFPKTAPIERSLLSIGLSLIIAVIGGLLLTLTLAGLNTLTWTVMLGTITISALLMAFKRRSDYVWRFRIGLSIRQGTKLIAALLITAAAFEIASSGALQQRAEAHFTQLWMRSPETALSTSYRTVQLGILNQEAAPMTYRLELEVNGTLLNEWAAIPLNVGEQWQIAFRLSVARSPDSQARALLYRQNETTPYRAVLLWSDSGS